MPSDELEVRARAAAEFLRQQFPQAHTIFLGGSSARRQWDSHSDVDCVVVDPSASPPCFRALEADDVAYEVHAASYSDLLQRYLDEVKARVCPVLSICRDGEVIYDARNDAGRIKLTAERYYRRGPAPLAAGEESWLRYSLTTHLEDLHESREYTVSEMFDLSSCVVSVGTSLVLGRNRAWQGTGQWRLRALRSFSPDAADSLESALADWWRASDLEPLRRWALAILDGAGGPLHSLRDHLPVDPAVRWVARLDSGKDADQ